MQRIRQGDESSHCRKGASNARLRQSSVSSSATPRTCPATIIDLVSFSPRQPKTFKTHSNEHEYPKAKEIGPSRTEEDLDDATCQPHETRTIELGQPLTKPKPFLATATEPRERKRDRCVELPCTMSLTFAKPLRILHGGSFNP